MLIQRLMDSGYPAIYTDELATKARALLRNFELRLLPVIDAKRKLVGTVTRSDAMLITSGRSLAKVRDIMTRPKLVVTPQMSAVAGIQKILAIDEWYAPVIRSPSDYAYLGMFGFEHFIKSRLAQNPPKIKSRVSEIMSTKRILCSPDDEVDNVWRHMQKHDFTGLPVVKEGMLVGMLTQRDLLERGGARPGFEAKKGRFRTPPTVSKFMKVPPISINPAATVEKAAKMIVKNNIECLPVIDRGNRIIGMVFMKDLVRFLL